MLAMLYGTSLLDWTMYDCSPADRPSASGPTATVVGVVVVAGSLTT